MQARVPTPAKEAQAATAGSRPTSQEVASLIEGFEDDFYVSNMSLTKLDSCDAPCCKIATFAAILLPLQELLVSIAFINSTTIKYLQIWLLLLTQEVAVQSLLQVVIVM